jgi:hypothetical protein
MANPCLPMVNLNQLMDSLNKTMDSLKQLMDSLNKTMDSLNKPMDSLNKFTDSPNQQPIYFLIMAQIIISHITQMTKENINEYLIFLFFHKFAIIRNSYCWNLI